MSTTQNGKKNWLDEELQENNSRINVVPLSQKLCIASSKMMGYITFIPKLLLHNMYFHLSFLKGNKQPIVEGLSMAETALCHD